MTALPAGWRLVRLNEVADSALGKMLDKGFVRGHGQVPYLRNVNVQWGRIDLESVFTMELADDERERFAVDEGDLLVCEGGEIGRAAIWRGRREYMAYQKALHRIRSRGLVEPVYLQYLFEHYAKNGTLKRHSTGSTIAHLPQQRLKGLPIPLAPLQEQRRIVDILEDHLSRLDAAGQSLHLASVRAKAMRAARFAATWEKAAKDHDLVPVSTLGSVVTGGTPGRDVAGAYGGNVPFLTPGDIRSGGQRVASWSRTLTATGADVSRVVGPHSVVVVCIGATLGKVGWVDTPFVTNQQINSVVIDPALSCPQFVAAMIAAPQFQDQMAAEASSTTMPILNKSKFGRVTLPIPDLEHQRALIDALQSQEVATERLEASIEAGKRRSQALRGGLLKAAFSGRLSGRPSGLDRVEELTAAGVSA